jgi:signal transduction histidine kinase
MHPNPGPPANPLPTFIRTQLDALLTEWDRFAATLAPGRQLDAETLRDHAREILLAVAEDMASEQSDQQQADKSQGLRPENAPELSAAARLHGLGRLAARFSLDDLAVEFRALRASVLRSLSLSDLQISIADITRFNEAIDQVLSASIGAYAQQVARTQELEHESEMRRKLLMHMESAQDAERRRIARELHDSLGQKLTAMSLCIAMLERQVPDEKGQHQLHRLRTLLDAADRELDHIVFQLRPMALAGSALIDAVTLHVKTWSQLSQVPVDLVVEGLERSVLPEEVEIGVFRVIQEALNNIAKHALASRVSVALRRSRHTLALSIEDDGGGFDVADLAQPGGSRQGYGLAGMRERVEALGGSFTVESSRGQGCAVLVRLPVSDSSRS